MGMYSTEEEVGVCSGKIGYSDGGLQMFADVSKH